MPLYPYRCDSCKTEVDHYSPVFTAMQNDKRNGDACTFCDTGTINRMFISNAIDMNPTGLSRRSDIEVRETTLGESMAQMKANR